MKKIMVVDDSEVMRAGIEFYFKPKGYVVLAAGSAEEALPSIKTQKPDLLLLDFNMPRMNGLELLSLVREFDRDVKVIMVSGDVIELKDNPQVRELGVFSLMDKPVDFFELESLIKKAIG